MEHQHAPWRIPYIRQASDPENEPDCFLCAAWEGSEDRTSLLLDRRENVFTILNKYPYNGGHLLVCPVRHAATLEELGPEIRGELWETVLEMKQLLEKVMSPHAFNIGVNLGRPAGAGLPGHVHVHIVPRWNGDTNFMPVVADTKVISQALEETWDDLRGGLNA